MQVLRIAHDGEPPADLSDLTFLYFLRVLADHPAYCQERCASSATSPGLAETVELRATERSLAQQVAADLLPEA